MQKIIKLRTKLLEMKIKRNENESKPMLLIMQNSMRKKMHFLNVVKMKIYGTGQKNKLKFL